MGTAISIDIPDIKDENIFNDLFDLCEDTDSRFSPYKSNSELSKLWRGQVKERDVSDDMKYIMSDCERFELITNGYFSARFAGSFNPTGYVKAWAIKRMVSYIESKDIQTYLINAGGDIVARSANGHAWNIAIANPFNSSNPVAELIVDNLAIATSGSYERGSHIYDPHTKIPTNELASVTIFGPDIIAADVFATAVFAMGSKGPEFMKKQRKYKAIIINKDGSIVSPQK